MNSIIIDTGSYSTKAGVYGENLSRTALFRSVIGRSQTGKQSVVGDAAIERRLCDELVLKHVVEEGQWSDMGDMEKVERYCEQLRLLLFFKPISAVEICLFGASCGKRIRTSCFAQ